jgi:eukaryotic-like serine/threonine-protein kinase
MDYKLEDFTIIKKLGDDKKRKFNSVYLVKHKQLDFLAVLKHQKKTFDNITFQEKLKFEASLCFENQNLPKTLLIEDFENELFVIKSYFKGITLDEYWKTISKKNKIDFLRTLLEKLTPLFQELKEKELVHSDIKPTNIIINGEGLNFEVYLIDFGLAFYPKKINRKVVFALGYSAPELILNKLHLANHSSDIFSLGICFWQLLEGKLPLSHPNPAIMTNLQLTHPIPTSSKINSNWNNVLQKMCYKASFNKPPNKLSSEEIENLLCKGIKNRYQSISEILDDIKIELPVEKSLFKMLIKVFSKS